MQDGKLRLRPAAALTIPAADAQTLLEAGNGDAALLYLHILHSGGVLDADRAATELHRSDRDIEIAAGRLRRMGLLTADETLPSDEPFREQPARRAPIAERKNMHSEEFQKLVDAVQSDLGRLLSAADLKKLFGIYDELALPADVIMLLIQHCRQEVEARYGKERTVTLAYIEKEAYVWVNREIVTYEQAEQWLAELERRRSLLGRLRQELGIRDRELSKTEREYLLGWLDLGFAPDAISIAYDRTVTNTHGLKWKYMDSILRSWHSMGLHTPEEIEKGDPRGGRTAGRAPASPASGRDDAKTLDQLARIREKMNSGRS